METVYVAPVGTSCLKVNEAFALDVVIGSCSVKIGVLLPDTVTVSCKTSPVPTSPVRFPPTVYAKTQFTPTLVTLPVAVPLPLVTVQICRGFVGCVFTVTAYASVGPVTGVLNVNGPFAVSVRASPPLSCRITLSPVANPVSVPPTVAVTGSVVHAIATVVTFAVAVPLFAVSVQFCAGF